MKILRNLLFISLLFVLSKINNDVVAQGLFFLELDTLASDKRINGLYKIESSYSGKFSNILHFLEIKNAFSVTTQIQIKGTSNLCGFLNIWRNKDDYAVLSYQYLPTQQQHPACNNSEIIVNVQDLLCTKTLVAQTISLQQIEKKSIKIDVSSNTKCTVELSDKE